MIAFNEDSFSVTVHTGCIPNENYVATVTDIIDVLQATNHELRGENTYYYLLELLRAMMPDEAQAKKLIA
jgi:hypothetical protein